MIERTTHELRWLKAFTGNPEPSTLEHLTLKLSGCPLLGPLGDEDTNLLKTGYIFKIQDDAEDYHADDNLKTRYNNNVSEFIVCQGDYSLYLEGYYLNWYFERQDRPVFLTDVSLRYLSFTGMVLLPTFTEVDYQGRPSGYSLDVVETTSSEVSDIEKYKDNFWSLGRLLRSGVLST